MMRRIFLVVMLAVLSQAVLGQTFGPETPILGKTTFGINGMAVIEVALPSEVSYNPAAQQMALNIFGEKQYAEAGLGILDFRSGPQVTNEWQLMLYRLGKGSLRLACYGITSDAQEIAYLGPGPQAKFHGRTLELSYGREISPKLFGGLTLVPIEEISTDVSLAGDLLVKAKATSSFQYRLGALYLPSSKVSVGAVYTDDRINAKSQLLPALTGLSEITEIRAGYDEKLWTLGVGWQPLEGTAFYTTWQKGRINGPNVSEEIDLWAYGLSQFLSPKLNLRVELNDKVWGYGLNYYGRKWNLGLSYSKNTYRRTEEYLGRADTFFIWLGKSW